MQKIKKANNASRAQDYLMQIVTAGYGFDVPDIQNALIQTNYKSVEAAVEYLFANQGGGAVSNPQSKNNANNDTSIPSSSNNNQSNDVSEKDIQELRERIKKIELEGGFRLDITRDIMNNAIKQNPNNTD